MRRGGYVSRLRVPALLLLFIGTQLRFKFWRTGYWEGRGLLRWHQLHAQAEGFLAFVTAITSRVRGDKPDNGHSSHIRVAKKRTNSRVDITPAQRRHRTVSASTWCVRV